MSSENKVHIKLNKGKLRITFILYAVLAVGGFLYLWKMADEQDFMNPIIIKSVAGGLSLFFLVISGSYLKRLIEPHGGLHLNSDGFRDFTSSISIGDVSWKEVKEFVRSERTPKFILVDVKNEKAVLKRAKNSAVKRVMEQNIKQYETPVIIDSSSLSTNFEEVFEMLNDYHKKYR